MPNPIKLSAKLPKGVPLNGLDTIHEQLAKFGTAYVIMSVSAHEVVNRIGSGKQPIMTIDHVEGLPEGPGSDLAARGRTLMRDARAARERAEGTLPGMGTDDLGRTGRETDGPYVEGVGSGAGWND